MSQPAEKHRERLADLLKTLEDMAAGELHRKAPISDERDEIDAIAYTINVVVGELQLLVQRLARAERESQQASQHKTLFLRNVSHELKTPLAALLSYNDLLAKTRLDDKQQHAVERIRANGEALNQLIEDLLDVARIEAGKLEFVLRPVSPSEVATDVIQSLLPQAHGKGLTLTLSVTPDFPHQIITDARRLRQILMNLVGNAVKFTDRGEVALSLKLNNTTNKLILDVTDTGVGFPDDGRQRLFSVFSQLDNTRGGVGLGLVLAKQLSKELGGDLELVSSRPGGGTHFRVQLEVVQSNPSTPATLQTPPDKSAIDLGGLSVLIAKDNADLLAATAELLDLLGCNVSTARNGMEAIERFGSNSFHVILMDMQMPVLDGLEAARRMRQLGFKGAIFALSAHAMVEDRQRFLAAGCDDHIVKPIDIDRLAARLAVHRPRK